MKSPSFFTRQTVINWVELAVLVALCLGVLVLINYISFRNAERFDLTPEKRYSLSNQSLRILNALTDDVHATIFYKKKERREFQDLIDLFKRETDHFKYSFIDIDKNPAKAEDMGIKSYGAGIVAHKGKKEKVIYFTEDNLISAIINLTEENKKIIRFVQGHGEKNITSYEDKSGYSKVKSALESENYQVEEILLMQSGEVPEDTLVLVVNGPDKDFFQKELDMMDRYLRNGGRVLLLCDPVPVPNIETYLKGRNIVLSRDYIIDTKSKLLAFDYLTPIVIPDKRHEIAKYMNEAVVFPVCRSIVPVNDSPYEQRVRVFAQSGAESWAERDTKSVHDGKVGFDSGKDLQGPVPTAVITEIADNETKKTGILVVMGDSDFATNHYCDVLGNKDLFLNTVSWLGEKSLLLSTRKRAENAPISLLFLTENENRLLLWSAVIVEPGIVLLIGIIVVLWRRRQA